MVSTNERELAQIKEEVTRLTRCLNTLESRDFAEGLRVGGYRFAKAAPRAREGQDFVRHGQGLVATG
jgi:hypothetical protein